MKGRKRLKMLTHVLFLKLLEKWFDAFLVSRLRRELDGVCSELAVESAELFVVRDVEEVDVLLFSVSPDGQLLSHKQCKLSRNI